MKPIFETIDLHADTSLKIASYGHQSSCDLMDWHIHPEYELVYVKNGAGLLRIDKVEIPYRDGVLIFLGPNIPHAEFGNKDFRDNLEVVIQFSEEFVQQKLMNFPEFRHLKSFVRSSSEVLLFDGSVKNELSAAFEQIPKLNAAQSLLCFLQVLEQLSRSTAFYKLLNKRSQINSSPREVQRLEAIFEYVNTHYHNEISTRTAAAHVGLTTNSFCRFFKKMTGRTFLQFTNEFRVNRAVDLLEESDGTISEIMYQCGFSDASYFTKQFRRNTGITPSDYQGGLRRPA